jgi:hypothetical protein
MLAADGGSGSMVAGASIGAAEADTGAAVGVAARGCEGGGAAGGGGGGGGTTAGRSATNAIMSGTGGSSRVATRKDASTRTANIVPCTLVEIRIGIAGVLGTC